MIVDFHTHLFPEKIRKNRENFFFGESAFKLLYESPKSKMAGASEILASMSVHGIDKSVVFGFPWKNMETSMRQNDYILESVSKHPEHLIGFCCVDPADPRAADETHRCLSCGLSGLGELAFYESGMDDAAIDRLDPLMAVCRGYDVPVLLHTNEPVGHQYPGKSPNTLIQIYRLIQRFSDNKIVLAHWGGGIFFYNLLKKEVKETLRNVWFDTAASPFLYSSEIWTYARSLAGVDKILFGTDYPLLSPERYFKELEAAGMPKTEIRAICGSNAANLLKFHVGL